VVRSEPQPVIDASVHSEFRGTCDSKKIALSNVQVDIAPQPPTNVPNPTALARKEAVVTPKETVTSAVTSQVHSVALTVLPKHVRIPIVPSMTQSIVDTKEIPSETQAFQHVSLFQHLLSHYSDPNLQTDQGHPRPYVTTSPVQSPDILQTIFTPTPLVPTVIHTTVPDVFPVAIPEDKDHVMGPPRQTSPRHHRATDTPRLPVSTTTANIADMDDPSR